MIPLLELNNVKKQFGTKPILNNISLKVNDGDIIGVLGSNGAGKSTLFKIILGILHKDKGSIKFLEKSINKGSYTYKEDIGSVLDSMLLPGELNLEKIGKIFSKVFKSWDQVYFDDLIQKFELPLKQKISEFSKGMSMKLSFAICMSHNPKLLIFDEATNGLDTHTKNFVLQEIENFKSKENRAAILSSHIVDDLERIATKFIVISNGEIVINDSKENILNNYGIVKCKIENLKKIENILVVKNIQNQLYVVTSDKNQDSLIGEVENITIEKLSDLIAIGDKSYEGTITK
ncbi:ABC transporter ATP-binding protein [Staphylococcus ureilyticus]|uniref:ABC transporter ATP-binding protein n=1 Tax=Staphylococcus ureilyticus TaxID=94138 RepID=UPI00321A008C